MNLLFLDTETTGLENARIVQLAYKKRGDKDMFIEYYKPPVPIESGAMGTHHITEAMVADKLPFSSTGTFKELPELLKDSVLVAHNAKFDVGILQNEGIQTSKFICTYKVAYRLHGDYADHKLQSLRYRYGIQINDAKAHDASGDVSVLEAVFEHMLKEYVSENKVTEDEAVQKFIEISSEPFLLKKLSFGKLRGMPFDEIREKDFSYLVWLGTLKDKGEDFIYTVNYHLAKKRSDSAPS